NLNSLPGVASTQTCEQHLENGIYTSIKCTEVHAVKRPITRSQLAANKKKSPQPRQGHWLSIFALILEPMEFPPRSLFCSLILKTIWSM
ncbi:unnamed protein product, partial [Allacma fusca]